MFAVCPSPAEGDSLFGLLPSMDDSGRSVKSSTGHRERTSDGSWGNRLPSSLVPESLSDNHKTQSPKSTDGSPEVSSTAISSVRAVYVDDMMYCNDQSVVYRRLKCKHVLP